ncbi:MAG: hypothetical protein JSR96_07510 [Proteobacteria bacterium]|nr:hypothetical protein [Pseudomonadota bacterium]
MSGGYLDRQTGSGSPYAIASVTRYRGSSYLRAATTVYKSTLSQPDAALPSTFVIGSFGFGGTWNGWVVDLYASIGRQKFGQIVTDLGPRASTAGSGSPYFAGGLRAGRLFRLGERSAASATASLQYVNTRSLRHLIGPAGPFDAQIPDRALSGSAALRFDRRFGKNGKHNIGVSIEHFKSNNGSTVALVEANVSGQPGVPPAGNAPFAVSARRTPDSWDEVAVSATMQVREGLWLDLEARRSFGAIAGDSLSSTAGLRWKL